MIKTNDLTVKIDENVLIDNVNLVIPEERITVIFGPNGAGKTTLLKTLAGIIKSKEGKVTNSFNETFFLPQTIKYPGNITLYEYLSSIFYKSKWKWNISKAEKTRINDVLEILNLTSKKDIDLAKLSAGEVQKANIGLGLLSGADVLLLDEPTSNMDLINQVKIFEILKSLKGITSAVILHDISLASRYGDYFIGVTNDKHIISGSKQEIICKEVLLKIYGINFEVINNDKTTFIQICNS